MKTSQFLEHHGIGINPFSQEDAQADHIFQQHCAETIYHPAWDKILGDCSNPSTSVVFGEKGAGKTALRIQLLNAIRTWNGKNPNDRAFVISYDDLNPFFETACADASGSRIIVCRNGVCGITWTPCSLCQPGGFATSWPTNITTTPT
jgi:hypothetical protein